MRVRSIATANVTLEPQVAEHADEMFGVLGDPAIYEYENEPPCCVEWLRERFTKLETRRSPDGQQLWLNWVLRLRGSGLIGYVQATVFPTGRAAIAYVLSSQYWRRGLASEACRAMIAELAERYTVRQVYAIFKRRNIRSLRLLERLGFAPASADSCRVDLQPDEFIMVRLLEAPSKMS